MKQELLGGPNSTRTELINVTQNAREMGNILPIIRATPSLNCNTPSLFADSAQAHKQRNLI